MEDCMTVEASGDASSPSNGRFADKKVDWSRSILKYMYESNN